MKWFKHYTNAADSVKLNHLVDELGLEGYGRYWLLLEMLCEEFDGSSTTFEIHLHKISTKLRIKFRKKLETFLQKLQNFHLIEFQVAGKVYQIDAPILLELQSRDFKKARTERADTAPKNKIKNKNKKKIKDKDKDKDKEEEGTADKSALAPQQLFTTFNDCVEGSLIPRAKVLSDKRKRAAKLRIGENPCIDSWKEVFSRVIASSFCCGENDRGWVATFDWLIQPDVWTKVLEGKYDNRKAPRHQSNSERVEEYIKQRGLENVRSVN